MNTGSDTLTSNQLERLVDVGRSLVAELDLDNVLNTVLSTAKEQTGARYAALGVISGSGDYLERFLTLGIDESTRSRIGNLPRGRGVLGLLINEPHPLRLSDLTEHSASIGFPPNHPTMKSFLGVPIIVQSNVYGNLYLTDKRDGDFTKVDEVAVSVLADWAGIAIANARSVAEDRLRDTIAAAERERTRWARELHDETLQGLAGLHLLLSRAQRDTSFDRVQDVLNQTLLRIGSEIANLRNLITELRPAALDELGLLPAIEGLTERTHEVGGLEVRRDLAVEDLPRGYDSKPEIESAVYRLVQEALTNTLKYSDAQTAIVTVHFENRFLEVTIEDDGRGFDPNEPTEGFGLVGMRERIDLVGGKLTISSKLGTGTTITAKVPIRQLQ